MWNIIYVSFLSVISFLVSPRTFQHSLMYMCVYIYPTPLSWAAKSQFLKVEYSLFEFIVFLLDQLPYQS